MSVGFAPARVRSRRETFIIAGPHVDNAAPKKRVAVLGSTGSVGTSTLALLADRTDRFDVVALAAGSNERALVEQCARFSPRAACLVAGGARPRALAPGTAWFTGAGGILAALDAARPD